MTSGLGCGSVGWLDALDDDDLTGALGQLRDWNLVDVIQNHSENYRTATEYERRNLQYSLTRQGEAALAGVAHAMAVLASTGALQTAVLDAIADRLGDLLHELGSGSDRRIFTTLTELEGHLDALRANTKQFNGELQRLLRADGADLADFPRGESLDRGVPPGIPDQSRSPHARNRRPGSSRSRSTVSACCTSGPWPARSCRSCPVRIRARLGWSTAAPAGLGSVPGSCLPTAYRPGSTSFIWSPAGRSSLCCRCSTGSTSPGAGRAARPRTSGSWPAGSLSCISRTTCTGCGRPCSGSAPHGTPISAIPIRSSSARRPPGPARRRSRCRRCCARLAGPSGSAGPAGCAT